MYNVPYGVRVPTRPKFVVVLISSSDAVFRVAGVVEVRLS